MVKEKFFFEICKTASPPKFGAMYLVKMHLKTVRSIVGMGKWLEEGWQLDANQAQEEAGVVRGISFPKIHFKNYHIWSSVCL